MTTRDVYRALVAAGWRVDADGALTNTPPGQAYCVACGQFVPEEAFYAQGGTCRGCRGVIRWRHCCWCWEPFSLATTPAWRGRTYCSVACADAANEAYCVIAVAPCGSCQSLFIVRGQQLGPLRAGRSVYCQPWCARDARLTQMRRWRHQQTQRTQQGATLA